METTQVRTSICPICQRELDQQQQVALEVTGTLYDETGRGIAYTVLALSEEHVPQELLMGQDALKKLVDLSKQQETSLETP